MSKVELYRGNCLDITPTLEANSVDSIITDPPGGISFMGKLWDNLVDHKPRTERGKQTWLMLEGMITLGYLQNWEAGFLFFTVDWATQALRVAKPGSMACVWAIPRTSDLTKFGLRLAGWEIRDTVYHLFGSGFPKSHDISKAIDKAAGVEREVIGPRVYAGHHVQTSTQPDIYYGKDAQADQGYRKGRGIYPTEIGTTMNSAPATNAAQLWDGWGTALKPAAEEWILAMKPREGTFANNALEWGVAGLNVDGCRIGPHGILRSTGSVRDREDGWGFNGGIIGGNSQGRWPANLVLDEMAARLLDEQSGERNGSHPQAPTHSNNAAFGGGRYDNSSCYADTGGASRFFYCAKASRSEREQGLIGHIPCLKCGQLDTETHIDPKTGREVKCVRNGHPTVKPLELCRWLCRLTKTPTGGIVLDPFMGSGSILVAAIMEGRDVIGIELERESFEVAEYRIEQAESEIVQARMVI